MGETILIAIVGAGSALAGALVTQWFEMQREERRARGDERHLRETHDNERRVRVETFIREQRAKQADRIRDWIERQLIASVDIEHLMAAAQVQGDPIAQGASLAAASTLLATRASSDGRSVSVNTALSGVTDREIVHDVRRLAEQNLKFRRHLEPLRDFLTRIPCPGARFKSRS